MIEIIVKDKQKYLDENYPFEETPKLADQKRCIHCGSVFTVKITKYLRTTTIMNLFVARMLPIVTGQ